ncbi:MAG: Cof-type HAD-IIB family hydrolase [Alkalispirochaetaceae bacterium]
MYRLLATDIDDTILAPDGSLPEANRRALVQLHSRGIPVVFSSGRATVSMKNVIKRILPLADDEFIISYNGARVVQAESDRVLFERLIDQESIREIAAYCREYNLLVQGYEPEGFLVEIDDRRSEVYAGEAGMSYRKVDSLAGHLPQGSPKLLVIADHQELLRHRGELERLGEGRWRSTFSKPHYLEVMSPGVSKGEALSRLADHLGIPIGETVAAGDSQNDREMVETAGLGVAVANARDELKAVADVVLDRSAEEGAIEELVARFFS